MTEIKITSEKSKALPRFKSKREEKRTICYLCGNSDSALQREHIIPRVLLKPNKLQDPPILSACAICNTAKSKNEEYVTELMIWTTETPEAEEPRKKYIRDAFS